MKRYILFFLLLLCSPIWSAKNEEPLSDTAQISILTCGTGEELYALFGHTAIRVSDPMQGIDRVYNYGLFDFLTPNFYGKFVKGDLLYFVDYDTYKNFLISYIYDDRTVYEQILDLNDQQKQIVWNELNESLSENNKYYIYKFIDQNCTTKVVDIVNNTLEVPLRTTVEGNTASYRKILNTYLHNRYFEMLGINLIFGSKVDKKSDLLFLPDKFMNALALTSVAGKPLVKETLTVFESKQGNHTVWWNTFIFALVLSGGLIVLGRYKIARYTYFFIFGLLGVFFFAVGFYSLHKELLDNNSILLCNPLLVFIPFLKWNKKLYSIVFGIPLLLFIALNITSEKLWISLPVILLILFSLLFEIYFFNFKLNTNKK